MIITIAGKDGSGKSTFAANLAGRLAERNRLVLLLNADLNVGSAQVFFKEIIDEEHDFRKFINEMAGKLNIDHYIKQVKKNENLYILSIPNDSKKVHYEDLSFEPVEDMFVRLKNIFDYVIVDTADPLLPLSLYAISAADLIFSLQQQTVDGVKWAKAFEKFTKELSKHDKYEIVLSQSSVGINKENFENAISGNIAAILPFVPRAAEHAALGHLLAKEDISYGKVIERIINQILLEGGVFGEQDNNI